MPSFGKKSLSNIVTCHEDAQTIMFEAINYFDFSVIFGKRGKKRQDELVEQDYSKAVWPMSAHNCPIIPEKYKGVPKVVWPRSSEDWEEDPNGLSTAFDIAPYPIDWGTSGTTEQKRWAINRFMILAGVIHSVTMQLLDKELIEHGIKWGGHFKHWSDLAHYELISKRDFENDFWWNLWEKKRL